MRNFSKFCHVLHYLQLSARVLLSDIKVNLFEPDIVGFIFSCRWINATENDACYETLRVGKDAIFTNYMFLSCWMRFLISRRLKLTYREVLNSCTCNLTSLLIAFGRVEVLIESLIGKESTTFEQGEQTAVNRVITRRAHKKLCFTCDMTDKTSACSTKKEKEETSGWVAEVFHRLFDVEAPRWRQKEKEAEGQ